MSEAEKFPGYLGCLLPDEVPQTMYNPSGNPPAELLLKDVVLLTKEPKFIGDRLLCVAVETAEACREAARRVKIDFEVKNPLMNVCDSMAEGAEQIEPHLTNNNIVRHRQVSQGDTSIDVPFINFAVRCGGERGAKIFAGAVAPEPVELSKTAELFASDASDDEVLDMCVQELKALAKPIKEACITPARKCDLYLQFAPLLELRK